MKKMKEAMEVYEKALELAPDNEEAKNGNLHSYIKHPFLRQNTSVIQYRECSKGKKQSNTFYENRPILKMTKYLCILL